MITVIINKDLPMKKGKKISQITHALFGIYDDLNKKGIEIPNEIVIFRGTEEKMNNLYSNCKKNKMIAHKINDAGKTQIKSNSFTALSIYGELESKEDLVEGI